MKKKSYLKIIIFLIFLIIALIFIINPIRSNDELNKYSYTKAICDDENYCEDYLIECEGKTLNKLTPTGFSIQQSKDWTDKRKEGNLCE